MLFWKYRCPVLLSTNDVARYNQIKTALENARIPFYIDVVNTGNGGRFAQAQGRFGQLSHLEVYYKIHVPKKYLEEAVFVSGQD